MVIKIIMYTNISIGFKMRKKHQFKFVSPYVSGTSGCCSITPQHQNATLVTADAYTTEFSQGVSVENLIVEPSTASKQVSKKRCIKNQNNATRGNAHR